MRRLVPIELAALTAAVVGCGSGSQPSSSPTPDLSVTVRMIDSQGAEVARVTLTPVPLARASSTASVSAGTGAQAGSGVRVHVSVERLLPGGHPFAIHAAGRCDPPRFTTAGPIFNPPSARAAAETQSLLGAEVGSLPDLPVGSDGSATVDFTSDAVTLDRGPASSLRSPQGTSLVVLDGSGGSRVACGVISAPAPPSPSPSPSGTPSPTTSVSTSTTTTTVTVTRTSTVAISPSPGATTPTPTPTPTAPGP